ncbi:MAG TPA: hypothetical protein VFW75_15660 [Acetobacteraceae bacterium]|nr:hypothetical protein [Acetobacteraceae bacterium]
MSRRAPQGSKFCEASGFQVAGETGAGGAQVRHLARVFRRQGAALQQHA